MDILSSVSRLLDEHEYLEAVPEVGKVYGNGVSLVYDGKGCEDGKEYALHPSVSEQTVCFRLRRIPSEFEESCICPKTPYTAAYESFGTEREEPFDLLEAEQEKLLEKFFVLQYSYANRNLAGKTTFCMSVPYQILFCVSMKDSDQYLSSYHYRTLFILQNLQPVQYKNVLKMQAEL